MERTDAKNMVQVLLVEDSPSDAALLQENLILNGDHRISIQVATSLLEAADFLKRNPVEAVLLDLTLPDSSGLATVQWARRVCSNLPVVVLTGVDDEKTGIAAVRMGVQDYLVKNRADGWTISRAIHYSVERKRFEEALRESEERFRALVTANSGIVYRMSPDWNEVRQLSGNNFINDAEQPTRDWLQGYIHPDDQSQVKDVIAEAIRTKSIIELEHRVLRADGTLGWTLSRAIPLLNANGEIVEWFGAASDITARKQAEEKLYILNKTLEDRVAERTAEAEQRALQLRQLTAELTLAEQRERQRISLVLHDGLQQILVAAKFQIALLEKTKDVAKMAADLAELIDDGIETSRSLTAELSPPILKHGGLVPALEWLVKWMHDKHGLTVGLASHGKIELAPEEVLILMFHSTRELLFNVVKHAGVRTARVEIMQADSRIRVDVEDEGVGFDPIQLKVEGIKPRGMGLFSIQERLGYLGGSMEIDSAPGRGSRFTLITPPISMKTAVSPIDPKLIVSVSVASQREAAVGSEKRIRVVLVDDHMVMRQGLAGLLRVDPDIEIIGESSDGQSAVDLIRELRPDVVLMDISMPGMDGIEATRIIHKELPEVRIIGLSMFQEEAQQAAMEVAGAVGYLTKSGPSEALVKAIRTCARVSGKSLADKPEKQADH